MMLHGVSALLRNSGDGATAVEAHESGGGASGDSGGEVGGVGTTTGGFSEEDKARIEDSERNSGGNRWPRQETSALLKIRSDMDVAFRYSSLKGPLWEEVSRKMAELGFQRNAKKCKEKFENVYKYHKRTKDGRGSKSDGKTYRFFDQLEALENNPPPPPPRSQAPVTVTPMAVAVAVTATAAAATAAAPTAVAATPMAVAMPGSANPPLLSHVTVPSTTIPINLSQNTVAPTINPTNPSLTPPQPPPQPARTTNPINPSHAFPANPINPSQTSTAFPSSHTHMPTSHMSNSTSSSTSSDIEPERRRKKKRKWKDFFENLMKEVVEKQEELQIKFLETLEKRERDRMMREEAWRVQEMARMNREHELLVQERSMAAAKDAAVIAFLQKVTEQQNPQNQNVAAQVQMQIQVPENPLPSPTPPLPQPIQRQPPPTPPPVHTPAPPPTLPMKTTDTPKTDNGGENFIQASSSRWPKTEVQALIRIRTNLDLKYQENGPKGPLWEEISAAMSKLGYNRSSKRCKEKWENINKYFKKVKESNKKRPEDSKTCPYFHELDALYKAKNDALYHPGGFSIRPENPMAPIMARPEQQWPLPQKHHQPELAMDDHDENIEDDDGDDEDEEDEGGGYEIVTNKPSSMGTTME